MILDALLLTYMVNFKGVWILHKTSRLALLNSAQLLLDFVFMILSFLNAYLIANANSQLLSIRAYIWLIIIYVPVWMLLMNTMQMYNSTTFVYFDRIVRNVLFSSIVSTMMVASLMFFMKEYAYSRLLFGIFVTLNIVIIILERYSFGVFVKTYRQNGSRQVIIVGGTEIADKYFYFMKKTNTLLNIIGIVHVPGDSEVERFQNLGMIYDLEAILKKHVVDEVVFALPKGYSGQVEKYAHMCEDMGITVKIVIDLYGLSKSRSYLSSVGTFPVLTYYSVSQNKFELMLKRLMDILGAIVGIIITIPFAIFIIPAIKLDSPGPIFFGQPRVGLNGRIFKLYKFRSMYIDAEARKAELMKMNKIEGGLMFKIENDPRITKVGSFLRKTSLDEFPQFFNVLKGDMSLVGTRPPTLDEVEKYERWHHRRISMKPGITGMWQVSGRSTITDFDEVVSLDTEYIDDWSIGLDIKLLLKTVAVVVNRKGSY